MMYRNFDTNELFTEEEVKNLYEQFKDEMPYDSFEDYIEDMLSKGRRKEGGLVVADHEYLIRDKEAGNIIAYFETLEEAEEELEAYEDEDRKDGTYTPDFYEIVAVDEI